MKFNFRKISIGLILIYAACMMLTAYMLFTFQNSLVHKSQVLSFADLNHAGSVFTELYLTVGLTLFIGLVALVISMNKTSAEVIYVEKKKSEENIHQSDTDEEINSHTLDMDVVKEIASKQSDEVKTAKEILTHVCKHLEAGIGVFYKNTLVDEKRLLEMKASYALALGESQTIRFEYGEGLVGQSALEEKTLIVDDIPEGYIKIVSGLGNATPTHLLVVPVKHENELYGVVEIASFTELGKNDAEMVGAAFRELTKKITKKSTKTVKSADENKSDDKKEEKVAKEEKKSAKKGSNKA